MGRYKKSGSENITAPKLDDCTLYIPIRAISSTRKWAQVASDKETLSWADTKIKLTY